MVRKDIKEVCDSSIRQGSEGDRRWARAGATKAKPAAATERKQVRYKRHYSVSLYAFISGIIMVDTTVEKPTQLLCNLRGPCLRHPPGTCGSSVPSKVAMGVPILKKVA
jgi:hypothetical protein